MYVMKTARLPIAPAASSRFRVHTYPKYTPNPMRKAFKDKDRSMFGADIFNTAAAEGIFG
jgi:hypothetical protein